MIKKTVVFLSLMGLGAIQAAPPSQPALEGGSHKSSPEKPKTKKKKEAKKETGPMVNLGYFNVPIIRNNAPVAYLGLQVTLEGVDLRASEILRGNAPKIYDAFFIDLYILGDILWGVENAVNMTSLKNRFEQICKKLLRGAFVKDVLFQNVHITEIKR